MSREEFERRYEAMPELKKAELINGRVYIALENGDRLTCDEFLRRYEASGERPSTS